MSNTVHSAPESAERAFAITRVFDAPRDLVFKAWTEAKRLEEWWGPVGFRLEVVALDLRPGGVFHYCMRAPNGNDMWGRFVYREITAPERLVYVVSFADKEGNPVRHPMAPTWPLEMLTTVTFTEKNGKTTLMLTSIAYNASDEERKTFDEGRTSMEQGFSGTMDQLDAYLTKAKKEGLQ